MFSLDVGSGSVGYAAVARGDVCLDIGVPTVLPPFFVRGDAYNLPFPSGFFDKVFFYDVVEHVDSPLKALREILRVLKVGSPVEISTPNCLHWRVFLRALRGKRIVLSGDSDHVSTWTDAEMENLLRKAGFSTFKFEYVILPVTRLYSGNWFWLDLLLHRCFGKFFSRVTGRAMIVHAKKL